MYCVLLFAFDDWEICSIDGISDVGKIIPLPAPGITSLGTISFHLRRIMKNCRRLYIPASTILTFPRVCGQFRNAYDNNHSHGCAEHCRGICREETLSLPGGYGRFITRFVFLSHSSIVLLFISTLFRCRYHIYTLDALPDSCISNAPL